MVESSECKNLSIDLEALQAQLEGVAVPLGRTVETEIEDGYLRVTVRGEGIEREWIRKVMPLNMFSKPDDITALVIAFVQNPNKHT